MRQSFYVVPLVLAGVTLADPTLQQMLGFLQQFNADLSYPQNIAVAKTINYTGFTEDVVGRVDVTETFIGQELNTEYLFGLFAGIATGAVAGTPLIGVPLNATLVDLVIENNLMIATAQRDFNWTVAIEPTLWQLKFLFNDEGLVTQYDAILYRSSALFATVLPKVAKAAIKELRLPPHTSDTVALQTRAATDVCAGHAAYCTGANKQYKSTEACMDFVLHRIPLGEIWQGGQNTAMCRYIHTPMLQLRPAVHCPHVGPSGGDMCFDHTYESMVQSPFPQPFVALPDNLTLADLGL
ncbi:Secreted protein [Mycena sanguinolenta]|uniref:Secreted protein n=1 Tax=Mycena sanguinolenta TaxID=230812 RepID=A0A8H7DD34_9AGAR|nr:Secreted protein [Mycena sanguinolenta]